MSIDTSLNDHSTAQLQMPDPETEKQDTNPSGNRKKKLFIIVGLVSAVVATIIGFFIFYYFFSSPGSTPTTAQMVQDGSLLFTQVIFRHGARAPGNEKQTDTKFFPRDYGQLTDQGYNHSFMMGRFLKKRYVDTGFLSSFVKPNEMEWRSRDINRCLSTASTVAAGMFKTENQIWLTVPIVTNLGINDVLLNLPIRGCNFTRNSRIKQCPKTEKVNRDEMYAVLYECMGGNHSIFQEIKIDDCDRYINEYRNHVPVPEFVRDNFKTISEEYLKVRNFQNGIGNRKMIKARFGFLVHTLLENLVNAWKHHLARIKSLKFKVYSSQDWLLGGVLDAFGVLDHIQSKSKEEPNYNTMIIMELWKKNGKPIVKFYYKPEEITLENHVLQDLTDIIPGCSGKECALKKFKSCCNDTRGELEDLQELCDSRI
ncbi:ACid Phosphatase family [Caenorhabditis elegans]|uniref:ACid Phosphatase family n=1 Tax=Caenorhabditis elegans TaxID=6239 RepID=Q19460_CAEEL|nr:ACid Phosphatase family [Caenorhabditis elegans]CAA91406.3 ACid Phosphatase family [Caenorhabditis elegans]|eukprot:NP_495776.1 ACid Phosphatase family [Caenorhabditis elegans]